jgi:hypothetical protein
MLIPLLAGMVAVGGCNTVHKTSADIDPGFGEAAKYDAALQIINPAPVYAENGAMPGDNGDRGAQAIKRYRTDQVNARHKQEVNSARAGALSTTQAQGGGSGGPR